ncbi:MAG TPA: hypothetical protein VGL94_23275 [Ktedonobacteraceae bacterium]
MTSTASGTVCMIGRDAKFALLTDDAIGGAHIIKVFTSMGSPSWRSTEHKTASSQLKHLLV